MPAWLFVPDFQRVDFMQPGLHRKRERQTQGLFRPKTIDRIIREPFAAPPMDYVLSKLSGKKVFTVLDQASSFWQVKLTEESSDLCAFNTPWRLMKFLRMPFGMAYASDIVQQRNFETHIDDMHIMADDSVIAGEDDDYHDTTLKKVADRARGKGVKFNPDKLQYRVSEIKYMCHVINSEGVRADPEKVLAVRDMPKPSSQQEMKS